MLAGCAADPASLEPLEDPAVAAAELADMSPADACAPQLGTPFYYRKGIAVTGFTEAPGLSHELHGLIDITTDRLWHHLDELGRFHLIDTRSYRFDPAAAEAAEHVRWLSSEHDAQFVIAARIQDLSIDYPMGQIVLTERLTFSPLASRNLAITFYLFDAQNGRLMHFWRQEDTASGTNRSVPEHGGRINFAWFKTRYGALMDQMLLAMARHVRDALECMPLTTKIIAVNGENLYIGAGSQQGLRPGDQLRAYSRFNVYGANGPESVEKPGPWIRIKTVYPTHSAAQLEINDRASVAGSVALGDLVRGW
jgi:hypothetical protein